MGTFGVLSYAIIYRGAYKDNKKRSQAIQFLHGTITIAMVNPDKPILFFDGVCNLCNGFVDFLVRNGGSKQFYFASLQGETAKNLLPAKKLENLNSVIFYSNGQILERSSAVLAIASKLAFPWWGFIVFRLIPTFLRDMIYDFVAQHRYSIFGKRELCRLPTKEERDIFLS